MNQISWTYLADNGRQHHVGLAHGAESGHLLVHCNSKVILIDFKVLESANYSVFIDEQLCEIAIDKKQEGQYAYSFKVNNQADTPRNRARKKKEKRHLLQSLAFLATLVLVIGITLFGITKWNEANDRQHLAAKLQSSGLEVSARILRSENKAVKFASYFFIVNGKSYATAITYATDQSEILPTGLPLETGDEFMVTYVAHNPALNEIHYDRPTAFQFKRYRERIIPKLTTAFPDKTETEANCLFDATLASKGMDGLANLYFLSTSKSDNHRNNQFTFQKMMEDATFKSKIERLCGRW